MSDHGANPIDEDLEMLEAIKATFGDAAADLIGEDASADMFDSQQPSLEELVQEIDSLTVGTQQAKGPQENTGDQTVEKFIVVEVSGSTVAIPMANVHEIQRLPKITYLPRVPEWVLGVTNLRGSIVSVVDFRQLLDLQPGETTSASQRLVMVDSLVDDVATGLVVDRVLGIRNLRRNKVKTTTTSATDRLTRLMTDMVDVEGRLVALLDIDSLLLSEDFRQFDAA